MNDLHPTPSFKALDEGRLQPVDKGAVVTQEDREAAAKCMDRDRRVATAYNMRSGQIDNNWLIQAFARHRHQSETGAALTRDGREAVARESTMIVIERDNGKPTVWCDAEIADIVRALNSCGLKTVASCSGHGHRPGIISLADGRELVIARDYAEARKIDALFPININGEEK